MLGAQGHGRINADVFEGDARWLVGLFHRVHQRAAGEGDAATYGVHALADGQQPWRHGQVQHDTLAGPEHLAQPGVGTGRYRLIVHCGFRHELARDGVELTWPEVRGY